MGKLQLFIKNTRKFKKPLSDYNSKTTNIRDYESQFIIIMRTVRTALMIYTGLFSAFITFMMTSYLGDSFVFVDKLLENTPEALIPFILITSFIISLIVIYLYQRGKSRYNVERNNDLHDRRMKNGKEFKGFSRL